MIFHDHVVEEAGDTFIKTPRRAQVQPINSTENLSSGDQVETRYRIFLPAASKLTPYDSIHWDGRKYAVEGDIEVHKVNGRTHHKEAVLHRVTG